MCGAHEHPGAPLEPKPHRTRVLLQSVMLLGAVVLTVIAALIAFNSSDDPTLRPTQLPTGSMTATPAPLGIAVVEYATPLPTRPPQVAIPPVEWVRPTAEAEVIIAALAGPASGSEDQVVAVQRKIDPLTIQPVRSRNQVETYEVKQGDNLGSIAARFGLSESTLIWSNERFYVNAMRVGMELTVLPVDGVYHKVPDPQSIRAIAAEYSVDPYAIIDSEFNALFGVTPDTVLPAGLAVVVPGGTGSTEPIYWDPGIEMVSAGSAGSSAGGSASFGGDDPGSCGRQPVQSGSPPYSPPMRARYSITQDYSWKHGGIDLAVPPGTSVYAAGGGTVVFAGWSTWGYGYAVVIAHGSTMSVYGHLNGPLVNCGQVVTAGQGIAVSGNSGVSSGPHLHFEIRGSDGKPVNPWDYQSF